MAMISLAINLELTETLNLARRKLVRKLKRRIEPYALKLLLTLGDPYLDFDVRVDSPAAIDCAPRVGTLFISVRPVAVAALQIVVIERPSAVVALNEPPARRVVMPCSQHQRRLIRQRERALHKPLAETILANEARAVVVLKRTRNYFRGRSRVLVYQNNDRVFLWIGVVGGKVASRKYARTPAHRQRFLPPIEEKI